jgi:hypothetical protein
MLRAQKKLMLESKRVQEPIRIQIVEVFLDGLTYD